MGQLGIDYGNTTSGFKAKRLADIVADLKTSVQAIIDPVSGESPQIDVNDGSVISQMIGILASQLSDCWQAAEAAALQFDPLANTGAGQSGTVQINGILRNAGYPSIISLIVTGTPGTIIPQYSLVASVDSLQQFATVDSVTIGEDGTATINARCTVNGAVTPDTGTIVSILTPVNGWTAVTNTYLLITGADDETDTQLRQRQQKSTALTSYCEIEAIYAGLVNVEGVTFVRVYQNDTLETDIKGIPGKSIAAIVVGGLDTDIALSLFEKVPVGIGYYGGYYLDPGYRQVSIYDAQNFEYPVRFARPNPVNIQVSIQVESDGTNTWPATTYKDDIKNAIIAYAAAGASALGAVQNFDRDGFPPGQNVILSQLYTPINSVPGLKVTDLQIAREGESLGTDDIAIAWNEVAVFSDELISVNGSV